MPSTQIGTARMANAITGGWKTLRARRLNRPSLMAREADTREEEEAGCERVGWRCRGDEREWEAKDDGTSCTSHTHARLE